MKAKAPKFKPTKFKPTRPAPKSGVANAKPSKADPTKSGLVKSSLARQPSSAKSSAAHPRILKSSLASSSAAKPSLAKSGQLKSTSSKTDLMKPSSDTVVKAAVGGVKTIEELAPNLIQAWRRTAESGGPSDFLLLREFRLCVSCVGETQLLFKENKSLLPIWQRGPMLGAYMAYFWPIHYQEACLLFNKMQSFGRPLGKILDLGCGPGSFALAALELNAQEVWAADGNDRCLMLLSEFAARLGHTLTVRQWRLADPIKELRGFDTIVLGHSLVEIAEGQALAALHLLRKLVTVLKPGGEIVILETGDAKRGKLLDEIALEMEKDPELTIVQDRLTVPLKRTRLMDDIMRSNKGQLFRTHNALLTLKRIPSEKGLFDPVDEEKPAVEKMAPKAIHLEPLAEKVAPQESLSKPEATAKPMSKWATWQPTFKIPE